MSVSFCDNWQVSLAVKSCVVHDDNTVRLQQGNQSIFKPKAKPVCIGCPSVYAKGKNNAVKPAGNNIVFLSASATGFLIQPDATFGASVSWIHFLLNAALIDIDYIGFFRYFG